MNLFVPHPRRAGGAGSLALPPGPARLLLLPGTRLPPAIQFCELRVSAATCSRLAGSDPSRTMEPGQPREVREPGPGAETAVAPRWEEAKTFYDNLSPKKKPKSVKSGAWVWGGGARHWTGNFQGGVSSPLEMDSWNPSRRGHSSSAPECARQLAQAPVYFGSSALVAVVYFPHPGLRFHARIPLPHAVIRGLSSPRRWQPQKRSRTALVDRAGQQPGQQRPGLVGSGSPAARCVLRSPASVRPARLPSSSLGS